VSKFRKELECVTRRWREERKNHDRIAYDRMMRLREWEFARQAVDPTTVEVSLQPLAHSSHLVRSPSSGRPSARRLVH
jgi:hypothetical protein